MCRLILIGIVISVDSGELATVFLPLFTVIFVVYDCIGFLFLWVLGMGALFYCGTPEPSVYLFSYFFFA